MVNKDKGEHELQVMAEKTGAVRAGEPLSPEQLAFAQLLVHRCAEIADRRDPDERPGAAIRNAFSLKERRAVGRPRVRPPARTAAANDGLGDPAAD
jgi:hypothetical protein